MSANIDQVMDDMVVNPHILGVVMKEMVRRATGIIRSQLDEFAVISKEEITGKIGDVLTNADQEAQAGYVKWLSESFPLCGIVAEEDSLRKPSSHPSAPVYFTVDPLDGTKAFIRRQSHGIGTMISLVIDGEIVSAWVGDIMTQEVYGFRPEGTKVHRISDFGQSEALVIDPTRLLADQYVLCREHPNDYSPSICQLLESRKRGGFFRDIEVTGGSVGIMMARLWKSEVGAVVLEPKQQTPWDTYPVVGISERMGFRILRLDGNGDGIHKVKIPITMKTEELAHEIIIVHESRLKELSAAVTGLR